jgi:hypothetical protein
MRLFESNCIAGEEPEVRQEKIYNRTDMLDEKTRDRLEERQNAVRQGMLEAFVYYHGRS